MMKLRRKKLLSIFIAAALLPGLLFSGCIQPATGEGDKLPAPPKEVLEAFDAELASSSNRFGIKLLSELFEEEEQNLFISPTSIFTALAMTYNGARGETKEAMADVLEIEEMDLQGLNENTLALLYLLQEADPSVQMHLANSLWMREDIEFDEEFVQRCEQYYHAGVRALDFDSPEAAETINNWVKERTGGHIEDMIEPPIHPLTILFLINAIYFQGDWTEPFDEEQTREDTFNLPGGETKTVPFMYRSGEMHYYEGDGYQAVRLPYGEEERLAMYVFLPDEGKSLADFYSSFKETGWDELRDGFHQAEGDLYLPRFTMEYEKSLNEVLKTLGMEVAFDETRADFFDMVDWDDSPRLFISEVKHKSFIDVDEKGTEAAAATSVEIRLESAPAFQFEMKVDRPFFFLIGDQETGAVPFMGTVADPEGQ